MTFEQMFTYHPPNPRTTPRFDAVRAAEDAAKLVIDRVRYVHGRAQAGGGEPELGVERAADLFPVVNAAALAMVKAIGGENDAVLGQYFTAAIERAALFRNACNEALVAVQRAERDALNAGVYAIPVPRLLAMAGTYAQEYRWLANGAIAIGDAVHFTPRAHHHRPEQPVTDDEKRLHDAGLATSALFRIAKTLIGFEPKHSMPMGTICEIVSVAAYDTRKRIDSLSAENRELRIRLDEARLAVRNTRVALDAVIEATRAELEATPNPEGKTP